MRTCCELRREGVNDRGGGVTVEIEAGSKDQRMKNDTQDKGYKLRK